MNGGSKDALVINQSNQISELQRQLDELNRKYEDAVGKVGRTVALAPELSNALTEFAAAKPGPRRFRRSRGIVKFKSDVTFATGSAELTSKPRARSIASRRSSTRPRPTAMSCSSPATPTTARCRTRRRSAGHKDNWYLSAHRAITVGEELIAQRREPQPPGRGRLCRPAAGRQQRSEAGQAAEPPRRSADPPDDGAKQQLRLKQREHECTAPQHHQEPSAAQQGQHGRQRAATPGVQ